MTVRLLRLESLQQEIACPVCRSSGTVAERRRAMNFSTNQVRLFCPTCRAEIGRVPFRRWNALQERAGRERRLE
ncbi:MAG: hypothetical protein IT572_04190 [Deltaproteobacteria bacterium]|nr:hypothetical protein [Deltaproteobacteria bacterium]